MGAGHRRSKRIVPVLAMVPNVFNVLPAFTISDCRVRRRPLSEPKAPSDFATTAKLQRKQQQMFCIVDVSRFPTVVLRIAKAFANCECRTLESAQSSRGKPSGFVTAARR